MSPERLLVELEKYEMGRDMLLGMIRGFRDVWYERGLEKGGELMVRAKRRGKDLDDMLCRNDFERHMDEIVSEMDNRSSNKYDRK